jgi:hypothetical protein
MKSRLHQLEITTAINYNQQMIEHHVADIVKFAEKIREQCAQNIEIKTESLDQMQYRINRIVYRNANIKMLQSVLATFE